MGQTRGSEPLQLLMTEGSNFSLTKESFHFPQAADRNRDRCVRALPQVRAECGRVCKAKIDFHISCVKEIDNKIKINKYISVEK